MVSTEELRYLFYTGTVEELDFMIINSLIMLRSVILYPYRSIPCCIHIFNNIKQADTPIVGYVNVSKKRGFINTLKVLSYCIPTRGKKYQRFINLIVNEKLKFPIISYSTYVKTPMEDFILW